MEHLNDPATAETATAAQFDPERQFIEALEAGEIDGDILSIDGQGNPVPVHYQSALDEDDRPDGA